MIPAGGHSIPILSRPVPSHIVGLVGSRRAAPEAGSLSLFLLFLPSLAIVQSLVLHYR